MSSWHANTSLLAALLLLPAVVVGQETTATGQSCPGNENPRPTLGISSFACHCSYRVEGSTARKMWDFNSEPEILGIEEGGPSHGILEVGDRIVAIDDQLITTPAGGRRWSIVRPGERVRLRIRRDGKVISATVQVGLVCPSESGPAAETDLPRSRRLPRLLPEGWLGIGVACDCSVDASGEFPRWTFHDAPEIRQVAPGSPADEVGLRPGDRILRIDGEHLTNPAGGEAFSRIRPGQRVRLLIQRKDARRILEVTATVRPPPSNSDDPDSTDGAES